jgi:hypothetical protein
MTWPVASPQELAPLELLAETGKWQLHRLPNAAFPASKTYVEHARQWHTVLDEQFGRTGLIHLEVFLHVWRMSEPPIPTLYRENTRLWKPSLGLGVWIDRPAPAPWTRESFMDASASLLLGEEPPLSAYKLLRLDAAPGARASAVQQLLGSGCATCFWGVADFNSFSERTAQLLLPTITSPTYRGERFYIPLLSPAALLSATPAQLDEWMCGMGAYAQESPDAGGLLILSPNGSIHRPERREE